MAERGGFEPVIIGNSMTQLYTQGNRFCWNFKGLNAQRLAITTMHYVVLLEEIAHFLPLTLI